MLFCANRLRHIWRRANLWTMMMGRYLDQAMLDQLTEVTQLRSSLTASMT